MVRHHKLPEPLAAARSLLLVIAHPDDESMFFSPSLIWATERGLTVRVLCLSNGNAAGLGKVREKELLEACRLVQVSAKHVTIVDDAQLQDGMTATWPPEAVAAHVERALRTVPCDTVLTFDARGVSNHINHRGVHEGVRQLLAAQGRALGVRSAWQLASEVLPVKFAAALAPSLLAFIAHVEGEVLLCCGSLRRCLALMTAHRSQWVWYRRLFVLLSSYTYVNRLLPLPLG